MLADLPWARFAVCLRVEVRKFFCDNPACPRTVFAERLAGIAPAGAHRTDRQRDRLTDLALALGGEEESRLVAKHGMPASPDTPLRLIRGAPDAQRPMLVVLGVDEWAIHRARPTGGSSSISDAAARSTRCRIGRVTASPYVAYDTETDDARRFEV